jgi:hypothetical protein
MMSEQEQRDAADCVVASCPKCGHAVFVSVTSRLERRDKNELGRMVADGFAVAHMPASEARTVKFGRCECRP